MSFVGGSIVKAVNANIWSTRLEYFGDSRYKVLFSKRIGKKTHSSLEWDLSRELFGFLHAKAKSDLKQNFSISN